MNATKTTTPAAHLDSDDTLRGTIPLPAPGATAGQVAIAYNAKRWATVPARLTAESAGQLEFACRLPPVAKAERAVVEIRDPSSGKALARLNVERERLTNAHGLSAYDVFSAGHPALTATPWIGFDGAKIVISGYHLPPQGDPSRLSVEFGPGVVYEFSYAMASPDWGQHYWYWPNASLSALQLTIDIAKSPAKSDPFTFAFVVESDEGSSKKTVWLPRSLESFVGSVPPDPNQTLRTQRDLDAQSLTLTGYGHFKYLEAQFIRHGLKRGAAVSILDWGCGHGRVARHFMREWPKANIYGADIDADNIAGCKSNLNDERFSVVPLWPPSSFKDASFEGLFGISVMTHLTRDAQNAWLKELARILKPGGIALLTFGGRAAAGYGSLWRDRDWWVRWGQKQFDDETPDHVLDKYIPDDTYYRATAQMIADVRKHWVQHFEILEIDEAAFGNQDVAVLRRR